MGKVPLPPQANTSLCFSKSVPPSWLKSLVLVIEGIKEAVEVWVRPTFFRKQG